MIFIIVSCFLYAMALIESRFFFKISYFLVALFFCVTYGYGYDWINYLDSYENIMNPNYSHFFYEPSYLLIMKLFSWLGVPFSIFWAISLSFIYLSVYIFCNNLKASSAGFFIIFSFIGYYIFSENIRQGIAVSICLFSISPYIHGNRCKAFFIILLATTFHITSFLFLVTFLLLQANRKKNKYFIFCSFIFVSLFLFFLYNPSILRFMPGVGEKFYLYNQAYAWENGGFILWLLTSRVFIIYIFLLFIMNLIYRKEYNVKINSAMGGVLFLCLTRMTPILLRFGYFMIPAIVYLMDEYLYKSGRLLKTKLLKFSYLTLVLVISIVPFVNPIYMKGSVPSLTIFSSVTDVSSVIIYKCGILNKDEDNAVIRKCWVTKK
ncbi:TPA: EpsG family protein [Raoultella ornithinolytica]|nr:EpsG family protein [Raoultella ornithinolytica]